MSCEEIIADLTARELLPPAQAAAIRDYERTRPFSLHYELRTLLYLGIVLLSGGLGVLLYQHLDELSHGVIIAGLVTILLACFLYAFRHRAPFTWQLAPPAGVLPDYLLLLGCLTFLTLEGYVQAQYQVFGTRYGLALMLPAVLFFALAYLFDHRGVLSMAITALAAWVGVSIAPTSAFVRNDFSSVDLSGSAILLGLLLLGAGLASERLNRKPHFAFTYISLGSNLALLAATAALFSYQRAVLPPFAAGILILAISTFLVWYARRTHSYLFLLMGVVYGYIVVTYGFFQLLDFSGGDWFLASLYFPLSAAGVVFLFKNIHKILRQP
ncbi:Predicted membrane protein [Hymenobacter daecheongensis DSM 21074]|uniref:Predicted membrane protein n=1 Tax=Hymenobacter daecheongensis DSM 21074 TaxID=1121955 RepID=A0A1M6A352_9BACT|nr:DUF2157 domain-containing protein [Hymenobacter daecheongensis]SHI30895.1 Predicted membrane protein [Hymenobacter daecheongensis DSM 21074]